MQFILRVNINTVLESVPLEDRRAVIAHELAHVLYYKDKEKELRELFDIISLDRYTVYIQPVVDGEIVPYQKDVHTIASLVRPNDVVHLFCC